LFDVQQGSVIGNLNYTDNENTPVLGFFEVAGVSEIRRYFKPRDIPDFDLPRFRFNCSAFSLIETIRDSVPIYIQDFNMQIHFVEQPFGPYIMSPQECSDCSWYATTTKPEWWIR